MKIALTYTGSEEKHSNYIRWLQAGEAIEIVKVSIDDDNLEQVKHCDALVIAGGRDIHPGFYSSGIINYPNAPEDFDEKRDQFEINAFKLAQEKKLPVLGICRGLQLVNCVLGGTLRQDLGKLLNSIHRAKSARDKAHGLNIREGSLLERITGLKRSVVNSAHHQAIEKLAEGLQVNCQSDDGTIEGIEWQDPNGKSFLLCVQWHPERMYKFKLENLPLSKNIRDAFVEVIIKQE